jgi:hypothetical protein
MDKQDAVASLGQTWLLQPARARAALKANDRLKLYLSVLQAAAAHAAAPERAPLDLSREIAAGLTFRPTEITARDTLAWWRTLPAERTAAIKTGLSAERERELRQECSLLASRLGKSLYANDPAAVGRVHSAAIRKFAKTQEQMSIPELLKKRDWLQKCLVANRLV